MASKSTQFVGARAELNVRMTLVGHEQTPVYMADGERIYGEDWTAISYFADGQRMVSGSSDKTTRLWDLRAGKEIREARIVHDQGVHAVAGSRDGRWIATASGHEGRRELKALEVNTGVMKTYDGHSGVIHCIDISADSKLLASGSRGGRVWIWSLETGKLAAGPLTCRYGADKIRFSRDSRKLAVKFARIEVWNIREQKLDVSNPHNANGDWREGVPMFWTTGDRTIVTAFNSEDWRFKTIYEFDASTLKVVSTPFKGHTNIINGLALSYDCTLLISASFDDTVKLWAFESRQLLASFNWGTRNFILAPDVRQIAYVEYHKGLPKICICDIPPDILVQINTPPRQEPINLHTSDPLSSGATRLANARRNPMSTSFATQSLRRPPTVHQEQSFVFHHLRKHLPSPFRRDVLPLPLAADPRDPLDCPATSHRLHDRFPLAPVTAIVDSDPNENPRSTHAPITQPFNSTSSSIPIRTRLSNWWHIYTDRAAVPVVSVPLAQGKERNATAGAPKPRDDCRPDEEFDSRPSSPIPDSQRASASAQATSGEHGSGRLCFCL